MLKETSQRDSIEIRVQLNNELSNARKLLKLADEKNSKLSQELENRERLLQELRYVISSSLFLQWYLLFISCDCFHRDIIEVRTRYRSLYDFTTLAQCFLAICIRSAKNVLHKTNPVSL